MDNNIRLHAARLLVELFGDEKAVLVSPFDGCDEGQAQITGDTWTFHIAGTPASWRHLAKVIEDAAMDLEGQISHSQNPADDRLTSPLGDRREQYVPCSVCRTPTWNINGECNGCREADNG